MSMQQPVGHQQGARQLTATCLSPESVVRKAAQASWLQPPVFGVRAEDCTDDEARRIGNEAGEDPGEHEYAFDMWVYIGQGRVLGRGRGLVEWTRLNSPSHDALMLSVAGGEQFCVSRSLLDGRPAV